MKRNGHSAAIRVIPALVTPCLARFGKSRRWAALCSWRAVALGMNDFGGVGGKWNSLFGVFVREHLEHVREFRQRRFTGGHERVAAGDSRNLSHPGAIFLAVQNRLVVFKLHRPCPILTPV